MGETASGDPGGDRVRALSDYKTGVFTYDAQAGFTGCREYGSAYVDGNTGEQVQVKNVLVLRTDVSAIKGDDKGRQSVRTTGTGSGQLFCDGGCRTSPGPAAATAAP